MGIEKVARAKVVGVPMLMHQRRWVEACHAKQIEAVRTHVEIAVDAL